MKRIFYVVFVLFFSFLFSFCAQAKDISPKNSQEKPEINSNKIKMGVSVKMLEGKRQLDKSYEVPDLVNTKYLSSKLTGKTGNLDESFIKTMRWIRANIRSIKTFTPSGRTQSGVGTIVDNFIDLESRFASLSVIPRFLDGIYDYQQDNGGFKPGNSKGARYHTALVLSGDQYIWTADILKKFLDNLGNDKWTGLKTTNKVNMNSLKYFNQDHLERLWKEKRVSMKKMKNITYDKLYSNVDSQIERLYIEGIAKNTVKRARLTMNFKQFK